MYPDVRHLSQYYQGPLGRLTREGIGRRLFSLWPDMTGRDLLCLGYGLPWAAHWVPGARRVLQAMPARQGVEQWPASGGVKSTLVEAQALPFADHSFDRILMVHVLEDSAEPLRVMQQAARVLSANGRLVLVAPHRGGLWSATTGTPFGHGRSFSSRQLRKLVEDAGLQVTARAQALFTPPIPWLARQGNEALEQTGSLFWPFFGGVVLVEACKVRLVDPRPRQAQRVFRPEPI